MKKKNYDGRGAAERQELDWVELSQKLENKDEIGGSIVNETISQIVSEDYLKVDTSDMDGVKDAVDRFYAYGRKGSSAASEEDEQIIRRSVDEKIIIRSEELKKNRKSSSKSRSEKLDKAIATAKKRRDRNGSTRSDDSFRHAKGLDKYKKLGILPTRKDGPSQFRKDAANWRYDDVPEAAITDEAIETEERSETFLDRIKIMSPVQWCSVAMALVLLVTSVMTTTVYADYRGHINMENAIANMPEFNDDASMIAYSGDMTETEDVEMESAASSMDEAGGKMLSLVLTSVEKDLKIKLVDEDDTLVKGIDWGVTVTDSKNKESSYEDDDEDGIIHLTGISAGDYSVAITDSDSLAGYVYPTVGQKVSVKAKVEYKVIANIKDEIKKESEVNAAAEDNGNKHADVETGTALKDTVEFVESSKEEKGETYVESSIDLTKLEAKVTFTDRLRAALDSFVTGVTNSFDRTGVMALNMFPGSRLVAENDDNNSSEQTTSEDEAAKKAAEEEAAKKAAEEEAAKKAAEEEAAKKAAEEEAAKKAAEEEAAKKAEEEKKAKEAEEAKKAEDAKKARLQLYDSGKNELYVCEDGNYRLAKYADKDKFSTFYKKVIEYVYTGWQNIDGRSYFYTKDHEKVTGDQVIGGVEYHFNSDGSLDVGSGTLGIDVSKYQPSINWASVKASGIDFVIIRCGYRGSSTGALIQDPYYTSHIKGAKNAGLRVGVYFFSTALTEAEAVEEASMCAELCKGYGINYPVFLDVESSNRPGYNGLSREQRTANIQAFCKTIASAGYTPGLYANKTWLSEKINTGSLSCKIWLAQYNANGPTYSGRYDIWQYTSKGHVDGISGNVDMNKSFLKY